MKQVLRQLFLKTLNQISLDQMIPQKVTCHKGLLEVGGEQVDLKRYENIVAIALGKAAYQMVETTSNIFSPHTLSGVVSGPARNSQKLSGFACFNGGHPYPNGDSFRAGEAVLQQLRRVTPQDLVLYLISGGGSALCEKPVFPEISLADSQALYKLLITTGINIVNVNYVRKHFSAIKGGRMTELAFPARQITIYVSDAPRGHPSNVASGPTMPDESTVKDCCDIVHQNGLASRLPPSVLRLFKEHRIPETPKPGAAIFRTSTWHCLLTPEEAVAILSEQARRLGWVVETDLTVDDDCSLERAVHHFFSKLEKLRLENPGRTVAILTGGEYSCPVTGEGIGGRNQAFVLECVRRIAGRNRAVLSAGTDGIDGISPAAGAVADGQTFERATRLGLDPATYARRSDSYNFFSRLDDLLMTGPTNNNVRDLRILVGW